jgi:hypothetical protein
MQGKALLSGNYCVDVRLHPRCSHSNSLIAGPYPIQNRLCWALPRDYCIRSNFWKFYLIKHDFKLGELVSLVKVFRLSRLERSFLVLRVWTQ